MRDRALLVVLTALALGGCAEEDYGPYRPPGGGGGGGSSTGGDARQTDAPGGDGGGNLTGQVCVVTDLRVPEACPTTATQVGVPVAVRGTAAATTSDGDGRFALAVTDEAVELDLAEPSTTLVRAIVPVAVTGALVRAPVITRAAWTQVEDALGVAIPDGGGAIALYVQDGDVAAADVAFAAVAGSSLPPFYDDGGALAWRTAGGTGVAGVALFVDVPAGTVTLDGVAPDQRVARLADVPVVSDAVTFVRVRLAAAP